LVVTPSPTAPKAVTVIMLLVLIAGNAGVAPADPIPASQIPPINQRIIASIFIGWCGG
jgi:hypothetical protein